MMSHIKAAKSLIENIQSSVTESYSSREFGNLTTDLKSLYTELSNIEGFVSRTRLHASMAPIDSPDVSSEDTLYRSDGVYSTTEGSVIETSVEMPIGGEEVNILVNNFNFVIPKLTATATIDKKYPVIMYINVLSITGDKNVLIDSSKVGEDDNRNPEFYNIEVAEEDGIYTFSFPQEISCVSIIRSRGLLSKETSMTQAYRTAASLTALLPGKIRRSEESMDLVITEEYVEDAPYSIFYLHSGDNIYVVDDGNIVLIKGRTPASSLISGTYTIVREFVDYGGKILVQGSNNVTYKKADTYVEGTSLNAGDAIVSDQGKIAYVSEDGSMTDHVGSGKLVYTTHLRMTSSLAGVPSLPKSVSIRGQIDNDKLVEIYEFTSQVSNYINSVVRFCDGIASMPIEYPIVTDIIRMHRRMGYDRAADLLSGLLFDEYMDVTESESSYESMLAEHTKTLQVKVMI